jgi:hypothetical protein
MVIPVTAPHMSFDVVSVNISVEESEMSNDKMST